MPELEELFAHRSAYGDVLQFLTGVRLTTCAHVVHVVNLAGFQPYIALDASKLPIRVYKAFAIREQHTLVSGLGSHILLPL